MAGKGLQISDGDSRSTSGRLFAPQRSSIEALTAFSALTDVVSIILTSIVAHVVYLHWSFEQVSDAIQVGLMTAISFVTLMHFAGGYHLENMNNVRKQAIISARAWFLTFFALGWAAFLLKIGSLFSRGVLTIWFFMGLLVLTAVHAIFASWLRDQLKRAELSLRRVHLIAVATESEARNLGTRLLHAGIEVVGQSLIAPSKVSTIDFGVSAATAAERARLALTSQRYDAVHLFVPWRHVRALDELRTALTVLPVPVVLFADDDIGRLIRRPRIRYGGFDGFEVQRAPLTLAERAAKRLFDIVVASLGLLLASPILLATALAVRLESKGPVLFRQSRKGFGGKPFEILKFRSMYVTENGSEVKQAARGDPRITRIGRVIRKASIDELPQLVNVLRGEMSIVGPRPHALAHDDHYETVIATYAFRHHVKPGLTGWAQIKGYRGETADIERMRARVEHDIWYINNWSIWLDAYIVIRTAMMVIVDKNAF